MTSTTGGFTVSVRGSRIFLVDQDPDSDPGISRHEARELAQRLLVAANQAEEYQQRSGWQPLQRVDR